MNATTGSGISQTPIADWLARQAPTAQPKIRKIFYEFLLYWMGKTSALNISFDNQYIANNPDEREPWLEEQAARLLAQKYDDMRSADPRIIFQIDNIARQWFESLIKDGVRSRYTCETYLGRVMGFFKYHRCKIQPQVPMTKERSRKKFEITKAQIDQAITFLPSQYRIATKIMVQAGPRPDSLCKTVVEDVEFNFKGTDFGAIRFRHSKRGKGWGNHGYLGPEVSTELKLFLAGRKTGKLFSFTPGAWSRQWGHAIEKAGLAQTVELSNGNGQKKLQHALNLYTVRSYFKDALDQAEFSKDWINRLMGHKLSDEDDAYTSSKLFEAWRKKVYPQVSFESIGLVAENLGQAEQIKTLTETLNRVKEVLAGLIEKGASPLSQAELDTMRAKLK